MKLFMIRDKGFGVVLFHVEIMRGLIGPGFDKDQPICIVGAGVKIVRNAAFFGARRFLSIRGTIQNFLAGARDAIDGDDEFIHR